MNFSEYNHEETLTISRYFFDGLSFVQTITFRYKYTYKFCNYLSSLKRLKKRKAKMHNTKPTTPFKRKPKSFPGSFP